MSNSTVTGKGTSLNTLINSGDTGRTWTSGSGTGASAFYTYTETKHFYEDTPVTLSITGKADYNGTAYYQFAPWLRIDGTDTTGTIFQNNNVVNTQQVKGVIPAGTSISIGIGIDMVKKAESSTVSREFSVISYELNADNNYVTDIAVSKTSDIKGLPNGLNNIGELSTITIWGIYNNDFYIQDTTTNVQTGNITLGNAVGFINIGGKKIPYYL